jgi:ribose 5-phosphate isomerase B
MKVSIGTDHRGLEQKRIVGEVAKSLGHEVIDHGAHSTESCDYPDIAEKVARSVGSDQSQRGILICGSGIGMSIAANKVKGVRAALCVNVNTAVLSRHHNNANVLCVPGDSFDESTLTEMVTAWLSAEFEGGRHARRVEKIGMIENDCE